MSSNAHEYPSASPSGDSVTPTFAELGVPQALCEMLTEQGITAPFPIQAATLIDSMSGRDVLGRGRTGSGKTLAFALPVLARLAASATQRQPKAPRALILAPTRELALQIEATFAPLAKTLNLKTMCIFGGVNQGPQVTRLRDGVDVVIACPGRLEDLLNQRALTLSMVEITGLDGFQLTTHLRGDARTAQLPIVMISGDDDRLRDQASQAGISLLLGKPYSEAQLLAYLDSIPAMAEAH
jgi:superfamily II DNA/RNA helicase